MFFSYIDQITSIQCEHYSNCSYKATSIICLHIFFTSSHLYEKGNLEVQRFSQCVIPLFNQVLAPPYALLHTYKKATCKAALCNYDDECRR